MSLKTIRQRLRREKREARRSYKERLREIKCNEQVYFEEYTLTTGKPAPKNPPKRSLLEEIGNSVTHGLGAAFAIVAMILMLVASRDGAQIASALIYSLGMLVMFTVSCIYHALPNGGRAKRLFRRFDYSCIYILIGATFAPVLLSHMGNTFGIVFFIVQWAVIVAGISLVAVFGPGRLRFIHIPLYVILGWSALMLMPAMLSKLWLALFILFGGIIYTLGIIPYAIKVRVSHFIWHIFVLLGAATQWIGIYIYVFLK
jgi:hemolysin III